MNLTEPWSHETRQKTITSRFFLAPINTGLAVDGEPTDRLISFHRNRSGKNIGVSYVGNVAIGPESVTNRSTLYFDGRPSRAWNDLVTAIHKNGSLAGVQLACRISSLAPLRQWGPAAPNTVIEAIRADLSSHSRSLFDRVADRFVHSAETAWNLGFDIVQIHAAHGYLLSQLMNRVLNRRVDEYRYDSSFLLNRVVGEIRRRTKDLILDIRVSLIDGIEPENEELSYKGSLINAIANNDLDVISISNGIYDLSKELIYPSADRGNMLFINRAIPFAVAYPNKLWNVAGNIQDLANLPVVPPNITFGIGRGLIADPCLVYEHMHGMASRVCDRCGQCHYYSLGLPSLSCPISEDLKP